MQACADKLVREMELFGPNFEKMPIPRRNKALANPSKKLPSQTTPASKSKGQKGQIPSEIRPAEIPSANHDVHRHSSNQSP